MRVTRTGTRVRGAVVIRIAIRLGGRDRVLCFLCIPEWERMAIYSMFGNQPGLMLVVGPYD